MTLRVRRLLVQLCLLSALAVACGDDPQGPGETVDESAPPSTVVDDSPPPSPTDDQILTGLAEEVAEDQRPGELDAVGDITYFDDPDGCASGEAAFVSLSFTTEPDQGEILFCRVEDDPGWEVSQGILYGE